MHHQRRHAIQNVDKIPKMIELTWHGRKLAQKEARCLGASRVDTKKRHGPNIHRCITKSRTKMSIVNHPVDG